MIVIVDYGMGNLRSVAKALESLGSPARVSSHPDDVAQAKKLIVPGVGAFPAAMRELHLKRLVDPLKASIKAGTPYLGICLGLQLLFERGEEGEGAEGLGILAGTVKRLAAKPPLKIPHMGWNQLLSRKGARAGAAAECPLLKGIPEGAFMYFVHSYVAEPTDQSLIAVESEYGERFAAMVWRQNLYATQFHPEKSQAVGLQLLKNFVAL